MKAVAYSIKPFEKEFLAKANQKKHDITLISNALSLETTHYAEGKDAVIVFTNDDVSEPVVRALSALGIQYIATRSAGIDHINTRAAFDCKIKIANIPSYSPQAIENGLITPHQTYLTSEAMQEIANQTIRNLDLWQENKCLGKACITEQKCNAIR